ncbi:MAG: asparagine synthetase B family protein, partial [Sphingobacteriales bacterium]
YKDGQFAFGSEMKLFKDIPGFDKSLNPLAFFYYLQLLYCPGVITPFQHVSKLLPGHYLIFDLQNKELAFTKYYEMSFDVDKTERSEKEWIAMLDKALTSAVKRQLMSDVPLGFYLSGGLDSSMIVAMAKKISPSQKITCFTIDTGDASSEEGLVDDYYYARKIADHLEVDLKVFPAKIDILSEFDKMIWHLDEPQADPAPLNVYNICSCARKMNIKVLLGGTAGDDIFSGYRRHQALRLEPLLKLFPKIAVKITDSLLSVFDVSNPFIRRSKKILREVNKTKNERFAGYFTWMSTEAISELFSESAKEAIAEKVLPEQYLESKINELPADTDDLNKMLYLESQGFLPDHNLNYTDKMSMAAGVETRVPFLDTELVKLATSMPVKYKIRGNETKYLLKKLGENYLPKDAIYRPKTGFGAPVRKWIREDMHEMIGERLSFQKITERNIFNPQKVKNLIDANASGKIDASYTIWALLAIESWLIQFFD